MNGSKVVQIEKEDSTLLKSQTSPPLRILVVDDDASIRWLTTEVLVHSGYKVDTAEDGALAWNALQLNSYDLMITDNSMPKVSGVELLQKLYADRMPLPVIMATGTMPTEFTRYPWLQPVAMLLKPFTVEEIWYSPGLRFVNRYRPDPSLTPTCCTLVAVLIRVIGAFGILAPLESRTFP